MRQEFWELVGGTRMGNAVGVKKENGGDSNKPDADAAEGESDYKKSTGFASHIKKKKDGDGPVSEEEDTSATEGVPASFYRPRRAVECHTRKQYCRHCWRDRVWQDDPADTISDGGGLLRVRIGRLHTT